jgi:monofunctional biosynthetic peptidoglycan transglycosylase
MRFLPHSRRKTLLGIAAAAAVAAGVALYEWAAWPDVAALATSNPKTTAFIERYKAQERRAGRAPGVDWRWVPYGRISPNLKRAVLVSEDIGFFWHHGFAAAEIQKSLQEAWKERELPRGASTITQQVAKNLWLSPSYSPLRKVKEAILTKQLERRLEKRRILEIYLNVAEFGRGIYGAEAASRTYFGKPAAHLSEEEAAELAASLPKPGAWHPGSASRAYRWKVNLILRRMQKAEFLRKLV